MDSTNMDNVQEMLRRPAEYENVDGSVELLFGFMYLGFALAGWLQVITPAGSIWQKTYAFLIYVVLMQAILYCGYKAIKNHITYPRTGFVEYRNSKKPWPMAIVMLIAAAVSVGTVFVGRWFGNLTSPAAVFGLFYAVIYAHGYARPVRWKWAVAGAMALWSIAIAFLPANPVEALGRPFKPGQEYLARFCGAMLLVFTVCGLLLVFSGAISLWLYVRHTQPPEQDGE